MRRNIFRLIAMIVALTAAQAAAQVEVALRIETSAVLSYESLLARVTVRNNSAYPLTLNGSGAHSAALRFRIERKSDDRVPMASNARALQRTVIPVGATKEYLVDLAARFQIARPGRYFVRAHIQGEGLTAKSQLEMLDVVPGLELATLKARVPGTPGVLRQCSLRHWARGVKDYLFLCVTDSPSGQHDRPLNLGALVRVIRPTLTVDHAGTVTVTHQINRAQLMVSTLQSKRGGLSLTAQKVIRIQSGPQMKPATLPVK